MLNASDKGGPIPIGTLVVIYEGWSVNRKRRYGTVIHRKSNGTRYYIKMSAPTDAEARHYSLTANWWTEWKGEEVFGVLERRKRDLYYPNDIGE